MEIVSTRLELIQRSGGRLDGAVGAEVGVMNGDFAAEMLARPFPVRRSHVRRLYLIDAWQHMKGSYESDPANVDQGGQDERYRSVLERFKNEPRVSILKLLSSQAALMFINSKTHLDFVYLDAGHDYNSVMQDLSMWSRVAPILFVHDFVENEKANGMGFDVVRAVTTFCNSGKWRVSAITEGDEWPTCELRKIA